MRPALDPRAIDLSGSNRLQEAAVRGLFRARLPALCDAWRGKEKLAGTSMA